MTPALTFTDAGPRSSSGAPSSRCAVTKLRYYTMCTKDEHDDTYVFVTLRGHAVGACVGHAEQLGPSCMLPSNDLVKRWRPAVGISAAHNG